MKVYEIEKVPMRLLIYGFAVLYLLLDLLVVKGPLHRRFQKWRPGSELRQQIGIDHDWAASVNNQPITKAQLNLAVDIHLARRGKTRADVPPKGLSIIQLAVLNQMINDALVRQYSLAQPEDVPPEFEQRRMDQFMASFAPGQLKEVCRQNDLNQDQLKSLLKAQIRQEYWLEKMIEGGLTVKESAVRQYYEAYKEAFVAPEVVRARHLFLTTVGKDKEARGIEIQAIHQKLISGDGTFETLCQEHSEDARTKSLGGELGWFSRSRMPEAFTKVAFALKPGEISAPFQTEIGWHIVEVLERKPERSLTYEEAAPEIGVTLENEKRLKSVEQFLDEQLRIDSRAKVEFYPAASVLDGIDS